MAGHRTRKEAGAASGGGDGQPAASARKDARFQQSSVGIARSATVPGEKGTKAARGARPPRLVPEEREGATISNTNRPTVLTRLTTVVAGIKKHITGKVTVDGVTYTPVTLAAVFVTAIQAIQAADAAHKQWLDAVTAMNAALTQANLVFKAFKQFAIGQFGAGNTVVLGDLGITAPKTTEPTAATKAAAALKAKATKEARGSAQGKRQKKSVKGNVQVEVTAVPVVTAPAASPAPATVPAAAPAAAPGTAGTPAAK
jgi:hypothetical protein